MSRVSAGSIYAGSEPLLGGREHQSENIAMSRTHRSPERYQRNALAPSILAAAALFLAPVLIDAGWTTILLFVVAILALITAWFAVQAKQWWWIPIFVAIAVVWNPVFPFELSGTLWTAAQPVAAIVFLVAGAMIKVPQP